MRYRDLRETRKRQIRYGAWAAAVLVMAVGLILFAASVPREEAASARATTGESRRAATSIASAALSPATASATAAQATTGDEVTVVDGLRRDDAVASIGDARRQAAAGNYVAAEASLDKAEKAMPRLPETQQARADIAVLKTPEGQFAHHILRARFAVDHDDRAVAETELAEAARLKADAPEIAELRAALQAAHDKKAHREARITDALSRMREAMARRDFAAANSALNEAERIDVQAPTIRQARVELARAQNAR